MRRHEDRRALSASVYCQVGSIEGCAKCEVAGLNCRHDCHPTFAYLRRLALAGHAAVREDPPFAQGRRDFSTLIPVVLGLRYREPGWYRIAAYERGSTARAAGHWLASCDHLASADSAYEYRVSKGAVLYARWMGGVVEEEP